MGAELHWPDAFRIGVIRFGPKFQTSENRDPYSGVAVVEHCDTYCVIGPVAGAMTRDDHDAILDQCANAGFLRAHVERNGRRWIYDLTKRPFKRSRAENDDDTGAHDG
jgi:hypothetical protein